MAGPPQKIMIIRHGEKPAKNPGKDGPFDVQENGEPGQGKSLIVIGWQRAGALNAFFAPYRAKPANPEIAAPNYIYAADPKKESARPYETVLPLATWLGYKEGSDRFNTQFSIGGEEPQLIKSVLGLNGTVLICWEHDNIMPNMVGALNKNIAISNYSAIPNPWPDVFYLVWVFDFDSKAKSYKWISVNQDLMAGDSKG